MSDETFGIIVASGHGERMNSAIPKQYMIFKDGDSVLIKSMLVFLQSPYIHKLLVMINEGHVQYYNYALEMLKRKYSSIYLHYGYKLLPHGFGGKVRKDTSMLALQSIQEYNPLKVLIHDSARAGVTLDIISNVATNIQAKYGVIPALKVNDTVKKVDNGEILDVNREGLHTLQTPQGFFYNELYELYEKFKDDNFTDESTMFLKNGYNIKLVDGSFLNSKITNIADFTLIESLLCNNSNNKEITCVGFGLDVHEFSSTSDDNKELMLGGVKIPYHRGLKGHSDADVIMHALVDAILGSIGLNDIGDYFPPSNNAYKGMSSSFFLQKAIDLLNEHKAKIVNVDISLMMEEPYLKENKAKIKLNIACLLNIPIDRVGVKATTCESMGFVGRKEGAVAYAVVSIVKGV